MTKIQTIVDQLKELTLLEASELVKEIETTFGVSAAAPVAMAAAAPAAEGAAAVEEKSSFNVEITEVPADKKIAVIKEVKTILNIGLGDAKAKVDAVPFVLIENASKEEANKYKESLSAAGATVVLK